MTPKEAYLLLAPRYVPDNIQQMIQLLHGKTMTAAEIAEKLRMDRRTVVALIGNMRTHGVVCRVGRRKNAVAPGRGETVYALGSVDIAPPPKTAAERQRIYRERRLGIWGL
jgi:predicted ArsR family transcriptional regulator